MSDAHTVTLAPAAAAKAAPAAPAKAAPVEWNTPKEFPALGDRCFKRWQDLKLMQMNASQPGLFTGKARFTHEEFSSLLRERFLLYVDCIESKPGHESKAPYLFA